MVALDYGQFYLHTRESDPDLAVMLLERAQDGDGIAQDGGLVVVVSPHQNNFEMPLRVEVWEARPLDDLDEWEEAFDAYLEVDQPGLAYESPTMDFVDLKVPPGSYHALITGRGFVADGWPGSTEPGDRWRIQLWPDTVRVSPRRVKRWNEGVEMIATDTVVDHEAEGRLAEVRIYHDLARTPDARVLSGERGSVIVTYDYAASSEKLYPQVTEHLDGWVYDDGQDEFRPLVGPGAIRRTLGESDPPRSGVQTWNWFVPDGSGQRGFEHMTPFLDPPSTVRVDLVERVNANGGSVTTISIEHDGLPVEWLDDMTAFWRWRLAAGQRIYNLGHY